MNINYVTMNTNSSQANNHKLITDYCDDNHNNDDDVDVDIKTCKINPLTNSFQLSVTDAVSKDIVQYSKKTKDDLIESALNNPSTDQTNKTWFICPLCNKVAGEANHLLAHFEQHFFCCNNCDSYFTNVEALNFHCQSQCCNETKFDVVKELSPAPLQSLPLPKQSNDEKPVAITTLNLQKSSKTTPRVCTTCGKQYRTNYKLQVNYYLFLFIL